MSAYLPTLPNARSPERSYTPLAGASSSATASPYASAKGTVIYPTRTASSSSGASGSSSFEGEGQIYERRTQPLRSESEETLSPGGRDKGKGKLVMPDDSYVYADGDAGHDLGEIYRGGTIRANGNGHPYSAKGKEREWDANRGEGMEDMEQDERGKYPPPNGEEDAERRIQDNLARFAARDMARRKAARVSRQMAAAPNKGSTSPNLSASSRLSFMSRPMSFLGSMSGANPRNSLQGLLGAPVGPVEGHGATEMTHQQPQRQIQHPYINPYDSPATLDTNGATVKPDPAVASPFADPSSPQKASKRGLLYAQPHQRTSSYSSEQSESASFSPHIDSQEAAYGYAGPAWRGGAQSETGSAGGEKWWHALCGWGDDLDTNEEGERDNQAGRTNPFE